MFAARTKVRVPNQTGHNALPLHPRSSYHTRSHIFRRTTAEGFEPKRPSALVFVVPTASDRTVLNVDTTPPRTNKPPKNTHHVGGGRQPDARQRKRSQFSSLAEEQPQSVRDNKQTNEQNKKTTMDQQGLHHFAPRRNETRPNSRHTRRGNRHHNSDENETREENNSAGLLSHGP